MNYASVQINKFIEDADNLLAPSTWGDLNNCFFSEWACDEKSLRSKAKAMVPKLKFLVKEGIVKGEDYVTFKNLQMVSVNYTHAIIIKKRIARNDVVLGGFCFSKKTKNRHIASYWEGVDHQGADLPSRYTAYGSWKELKDELKRDCRPRLAAKEIFRTDSHT